MVMFWYCGGSTILKKTEISGCSLILFQLSANVRPGQLKMSLCSWWATSLIHPQKNLNSLLTLTFATLPCTSLKLCNAPCVYVSRCYHFLKWELTHLICNPTDACLSITIILKKCLAHKIARLTCCSNLMTTIVKIIINRSYPSQLRCTHPSPSCSPPQHINKTAMLKQILHPRTILLHLP